MTYRVLAAAALLATTVCSTAYADKCKDTPIGQMTLGLLEECEIRADMIRGINELFAKTRATEQPGYTPSERECLDAYRTGAKVRGCFYTMSGGKVTVDVFPAR